MNMNVYLDSAATTKVDERVLEAMLPYLRENFGNPSSHYELGREAKKAIDDAREIIASAINAKPTEIIFTSGGSEANNMAIKCTMTEMRGSVVTSNIEHHSVLNSCKDIKRLLNCNTFFAKNDENGIITADAVDMASRWDTSLVSIMMVNNEIGTIEPIKEIADFCQAHNMVIHTDAVQAFGHIPIDVKNLDVDLLSASGHKIHAPKGVGFLYMREHLGKYIYPLISGGQQERGLRASTENVASIVGLGKATELMMANMEWNQAHAKTLCEYLLEKLSDVPECHVNNDILVTDYRHINLNIDGIPAEVMLGMLDAVGVYVSSGSACNSDSGEPSHVLKAIGLSDEDANSSIRVSIDTETTKRDIDLFVGLLKSNIQTYKGVVA